MLRIGVEEGKPGAVAADQRAEREAAGQCTADRPASTRDPERQLPSLRWRQAQAAGPRRADRTLRRKRTTAPAPIRSDQDHDEDLDQAAFRDVAFRANVREQRT